jgi:hypothetical protein
MRNASQLAESDFDGFQGLATSSRTARVQVLKANGHKTLIFFQMTRMMDIVEDYLTLIRGWKFCRIDGGVAFQVCRHSPQCKHHEADEDLPSKRVSGTMMASH